MRGLNISPAEWEEWRDTGCMDRIVMLPEYKAAGAG
jgi:hypothetical protein